MLEPTRLTIKNAMGRPPSTILRKFALSARRIGPAGLNDIPRSLIRIVSNLAFSRRGKIERQVCAYRGSNLLKARMESTPPPGKPSDGREGPQGDAPAGIRFTPE